VDARVANVVRSPTEALARSGVKIGEVKLYFETDYNTLAHLWARYLGPLWRDRSFSLSKKL
jgi:hypothetical protein